MVQAEKVESTSRHGVLGRHTLTPTERGFKFYQTRCNAVILFDTLPAYVSRKLL